MNSAELKKVNSGDKFAPKAADWNAFIDAAVAVRAGFADQTSNPLLRTSHNGIIPIQNDTGVDLDQFAVLSLDTLLITPTDNEDEFRHRPPVFSGIAIDIAKPFAILQEPIKAGLIGQAMVAGVTPVIIAISDESAAFAELTVSGLQSAASGIARILWKESGTGTKWAIIHFPSGGGGGSAVSTFPAKVVSKSGLYHLCDIYANGIDNAASATNQKVFVLQLNLAETLPAGTWIMVSQSQIGETGGGNVP